MGKNTDEKSLKKMMSLLQNIHNSRSYQQIIKVASKKLGDIYLSSEQIDLAEKLYLISNFISPNDAGVLANLAKFYYENNNTDKAFSFIVKAVESSRDDSELLLNAGIVAADCGKGSEAENFYNSVLRLDPNNHKAKFGISIEHFKKGNLKEAYELFTNRHAAFQTDKTICPLLSAIPKWNGKDAGNIIVYNEQGYGDFIFGIRYLELIKNKFFFYIDKNINSLFKNTIYKSLNKRVLKKVKYRCSILDIPSLLQSYSFNTDAYQKVFGVYKNKKLKNKIGLVFSGGKNYSADKRRSIHLSRFEKLLSNKEYSIMLFQKDMENNNYMDYKLPKHVKICSCKDFQETLQEIKQMDCLITVDTSVAHLAGAIGLPTFVLMEKYPDYRWWLSDTNTPWYDSWRLYKQDVRGEWQKPIDRLILDIKRFFNGPRRNCL